MAYAYATDIQFSNNTQGTYEPQLVYEDFVRLATAQLDPEVAPDYGILITHNQCRYAVTDGDIMIEYREDNTSGTPWGWWNIRDQYLLSGASASLEGALREWTNSWLDRRLNWLDQASQPED